MPTIIENFAKTLRSAPGAAIQVEHSAHEMLATMDSGAGRKQVVKVSLIASTQPDIVVVRLLSRACRALDHRLVREALRANAGAALGNLALDPNTTPATINVVYNLVAENLQFGEFLTALQHVARHADTIERNFEQTDRF